MACIIRARTRLLDACGVPGCARDEHCCQRMDEVREERAPGERPNFIPSYLKIRVVVGFLSLGEGGDSIELDEDEGRIIVFSRLPTYDETQYFCQHHRRRRYSQLYRVRGCERADVTVLMYNTRRGWSHFHFHPRGVLSHLQPSGVFNRHHVNRYCTSEGSSRRETVRRRCYFSLRQVTSTSSVLYLCVHVVSLIGVTCPS